MTSLLDILTEEKRLIDERSDVKDKIVSHLYVIDDAIKYPKHYKNLDVDREEELVSRLRIREDELEAEIKNTRNSLARYLLKLYKR